MRRYTSKCLSRWFFVVASGLWACSFQTPKESEVFGQRAQGGNTFASGGGSAGKGGATQADKGGTAGEQAVGGATSLGASTSTGVAGGGSNSAGGAISAGGITATAGTSPIGGASAVGGRSTTGGASAAGGTAATGGISGIGGAISRGGASTTGGMPATGGATSAGGASTTGGAISTGGTIATGGVSSTGGASTTGGVSSTGGTSTTGGVGAAGGTNAAGGVSATGGATSIVLPPAVPILKYDFNVLTDTVATDSTLHANDGTLTGVTLSAAGRNVGGLILAEADSKVAMPLNLLNQVHMLNVSAWVKLSAESNGNRLFTFGDGATSYLYLTLNNGEAIPGISLKFLAPGGTEKDLTTPTQLPLNVWKHLTVTMTAAGTAIYVDGKVVAQNNSLIIDPSTLGTTTGDFVGNSDAGTNAFQGMLDEFHLYEGALTRSEILLLAAPKLDYSIYHFDEGTGTTTQDSSDRHVDGTLIGGAAWVPGIVGGAVRLDNPNVGPSVQYIDLADGIIQNCTTNLTIAGWVNLETNYYMAAFVDISPSEAAGLHFGTAYKTVTDLHVLLQTGTSTWHSERTTRTWTMAKWYHIAMVRSGTGSTITFYVDGVVSAHTGGLWTATTSVDSWGATTQNYFGKSRDAIAADTYPGLDATIDEILISCRAYSASEIAQLAFKPL